MRRNYAAERQRRNIPTCREHKLHIAGQSPREDGQREGLERTASFCQNHLLVYERNAQGRRTAALWPERKLQELRKGKADDQHWLTSSSGSSLFQAVPLPLLFPTQPCPARNCQEFWGYGVPRESGGLSCGSSGIWGLMQV